MNLMVFFFFGYSKLDTSYWCQILTCIHVLMQLKAADDEHFLLHKGTQCAHQRWCIFGFPNGQCNDFVKMCNPVKSRDVWGFHIRHRGKDLLDKTWPSLRHPWMILDNENSSTVCQFPRVPILMNTKYEHIICQLMKKQPFSSLRHMVQEQIFHGKWLLLRAICRSHKKVGPL